MMKSEHKCAYCTSTIQMGMSTCDFHRYCEPEEYYKALNLMKC